MSDGKKPKTTRAIGNDASVLDQRLRVLAHLNRVKADYIVIGGVAINFHGVVRATKDIDLLIPKDLANTKKIMASLQETQLWGLARELDAEQVTHKPFTIIGDQPRVDLLTVAGKITFEKARPHCLTHKVKNVDIPYADLDTLIETKQTGRPSDISDLIQLKAIKERR